MGVSQAVQGAGDQGIMFGYANSDTNALMPMPIYLAHNLMRKAADVRRLPGGDILRPDAKSQVTVEYEDNKPVKVRNVVLSHQHAGDADVPALRQMLYETVIQPTIRDAGFDVAFDECLINPTGRFAIGGPNGDTGLTGRKIIVDTYGGMGRHAGGAFSGKDPSKVDRSAAYMARHIAKALVANRYATECEVQLAYAIGIARPTSLYVNTFGTGTKSDAELEVLVRDHFDCTPAGIINTLDLKRPIYESTASYGHFGRAEFSWEDTAIL
jgi:S-adenosylmethionine synthetase